MYRGGIITFKRKKRFMDGSIRTIEKIVSKHPFFARIYTVFFEKMTVDEFAMVSIPKDSRIVNIGCGSLPHTLITLTKANGWKFLGIDRDQKAIEKAKKIIEYLNLTDMIEIRHCNGMDFNFSEFDFIIVSHGVEPKKELLEKLGNQIKKDSVILYRTTWKSLNKVYGDEPVPDNLKIVKSYDRVDGIRSILLKRNENNK